MEYSYQDIAKTIDHALLKPTLTTAELDAGCRMAAEYDVASVCILPFAVARCAKILRDSSVKPSTTIGFPHGANATAAKVAEAQQALSDGAEELDMVVNIGQVLSAEWDYVRDDILAVIQIVHAAGHKAKVIFENCYLDTAQKKALCAICAELDADWVKTSTGFGSGGATIEDLELMIENTPDRVQVKASGGIANLDTVLEIRALGVTRIGASATKSILAECIQRVGR